ncbi:MAG: DUF6125 family protein [Candidatus Bipolaricaulota bacterium]|nr:DUF6125 family protein [Candidatus Bipolaricaulota bacterium]
MPDRSPLRGRTEDELIDLLEDAAKNWLAMDGLWFLAVEERFGLERAVELDRKVWERFSPLEARRILRRRGIAPGGGLPALAEALSFRLYARINDQEIAWTPDGTLVLRMKTCRVQEARNRDGRPFFPCREVGLVEYAGFARAVDERVAVRCLGCPPERPEGAWCAWEFAISGAG